VENVRKNPKPAGAGGEKAGWGAQKGICARSRDAGRWSCEPQTEAKRGQGGTKGQTVVSLMEVFRSEKIRRGGKKKRLTKIV